MAQEKPSIESLPMDFVLSSLTRYQKENIVLRYIVCEKFAKLRLKGIGKIDSYYQIADEVGLQPDTINKMCKSGAKSYQHKTIL
jgi:hypothetical protein